MAAHLRGGFTLVELLVVIAIIGVLVALLLPAVQAARESARRISCTNNLKQIGLALHEYLGAKKTFPPGQSVFTNPPNTSSPIATDPWAWSFLILPYMDQQSLFDMIQNANPGNPLLAPTNTALYVSTASGRNGNTTVIPTYLCPSVSGAVDPSRNQTTNQLQYYAAYTASSGNTPAYAAGAVSGAGMACSDYGGIEGPDNVTMTNAPIYNPATITSANPNGIQYAKGQGMMPKMTTLPATAAGTSPAISPRTVTDGMSKTMIVGEEAGRGYNWAGGKISGTWADGLNIGNLTLQFSGPPTGAFPSKLTPDSKTVPGSYTTWCPAYGADELIAFHPNGGMILLSDGSAQFINQEIAASIIWSLATRNGGETIEDGVIGD